MKRSVSLLKKPVLGLDQSECYASPPPFFEDTKFEHSGGGGVRFGDTDDYDDGGDETGGETDDYDQKDVDNKSTDHKSTNVQRKNHRDGGETKQQSENNKPKMQYGLQVPATNCSSLWDLLPSGTKKNAEALSRRPHQFPHVWLYQNTIVAGRDRQRRMWWFQTPIAYPDFGLPSHSLLPIESTDSEIQAFMTSMRNGVVTKNKQWQFYPNNDADTDAIVEWWSNATDACIKPVCSSASDVFDPIRGVCRHRHTVTQINTNNNNNNKPNPTSKKWTLPYLIVWERTHGKHQLPQVWLTGVARKDDPALFAFPYPLPVPFEYEFNSDVYGVPDVYVSALNQQLVKGNSTMLTVAQTNDILTSLFELTHDYIVFPSRCFASTKSRANNPSHVLVLNQQKMYSTLSSTANVGYPCYVGVTDATRPYDRALVLTVLDSQGRLLLPQSVVEGGRVYVTYDKQSSRPVLPIQQ